MEEFELLDETIGFRLRKTAAQYPDRECIIFPERGYRITYSKFDKLVDDYCIAMVKLGICADTKVGLWAPNCPEWPVISFAAARVGAVLVPINTHYKLEELRFALADSGIHTLFTIEGLKRTEYLDMLFSLIPEIKASGDKKWRSKLFPELENIVVISENSWKGTIKYSSLGGNNWERHHKLIESREKQFDCNSIASLQYTSGTTGQPKGVLLTHHNLLNNACSYLSISPERATVLCFLPLFHSYGFVIGMMSTIFNGSTLVLMNRFLPTLAFKAISDEHCDKMFGVPVMFKGMLKEEKGLCDKYDLSSLRICITGGAACEPELIYDFKKRFNCKFVNGYGITETSPVISVPRYNDDMEDIAHSVGQPIPQVLVKVINQNTGESCPSEINGEICVKGFTVMKGYYNNPQATSEAIDQYGYYHTGDIGFLDKKGFIHITGRIKDLIIRAGENIYPKEIEEFLYGIPSIEHVEIVGVHSNTNGEVVAAFVHLRPGCYLTQRGIINYCTGNIAAYKIPRYVFFVDEFPLTASGKVRKNILREMAEEEVNKMKLR